MNRNEFDFESRMRKREGERCSRENDTQTHSQCDKLNRENGTKEQQKEVR